MRRRTFAAVARRARARAQGRKDQAFLAWVASWPCLVATSRGTDATCLGGVQAHHEPPKSHAGEWSDRLAVPLCAWHHDSRHHVLGSLELFEAAWGVDVAAEIERLNGTFEGPLF